MLMGTTWVQTLEARLGDLVPLSRAFYHQLEVVTFFSDFVFSFVPGPFLRADEDLGRYMKLLDFFESKVMNLTRVIFQVKEKSSYPLGINDPPMVR